MNSDPVGYRWRDKEVRMDPISLVVAALTAGASAALKDTTESTIKGTFRRLQELARRIVGADPAKQSDFPFATQEPQGDFASLEARLRAAGADYDNELLATARLLLEQLDPPGALVGKYHVRLGSSQGIVIGDHSTVTMRFDENR
jgi:hypothetical protein